MIWKKKVGPLILFAVLPIALYLVIDLSISPRNPRFPNTPFLLIVLDARNVQSVVFTNSVLGYIERNGLPINTGIVFLRSKTFSFNGQYKILNKRDVPKQYLKNDYFYFFSSPGVVSRKGELWMIPDSLLRSMNPQYEIITTSAIDSFAYLYKTIEEVPFFIHLKYSLSPSLTCFIFFEEICDCNASVKTIQRIMETDDSQDGVFYYFVPMSEYTHEELDLIKTNNHFSINFLQPNQKELEQWRLIKKDVLHKHPLEGLMLMADSRGRVIYVSNKWEDYQALVGRLNN